MTTVPVLVRRLGSAPAQPAPASSSLSADGTTTAPAPGLPLPGAGAPPAHGPTVAELEAIEAEWPVIAAEVALVDAECRYLARPSAASRAAVRAAEAAVIRAHLLNASQPPTPIGARP